MKRNRLKVIIIAMSIIFIAVGAWYFFPKTEDTSISIQPKRGEFKVTITTSGELKAKKSIEIRGPSGLERIGIHQLKISKIIPEGTVVKEGDYVADLDRSEIMNKIREMETKIQQFETQFLQSRLDSSLNLSTSRIDILNMQLSLEERRIAKEQSIYEAPSVQRQAEIAYERELRNYDQSIKNYGTKVEQAIAKLEEVGLGLALERQNMARLMQLFDDFTIKAPADGMVIYTRDWNGSRRGEGSTINSWWPVVANLPDLSVMESITYVNEIDIQRIRNNQIVDISLDANPDKKLTGKVIKVANIGEERRNSDSKVFEVLIEVTEKDTTLLPSMTTSNRILVAHYDDVVFVPLETVHTENNKDNKFTYVFKKIGSKIIKQEVKLGEFNENEVIVEKGISQNDVILLNIPINSESMEVSLMKKEIEKPVEIKEESE